MLDLGQLLDANSVQGRTVREQAIRDLAQIQADLRTEQEERSISERRKQALVAIALIVIGLGALLYQGYKYWVSKNVGTTYMARLD